MLTDTNSRYCSPELWGGIECSINRIENSFFDQLAYSGFYNRENDIESFAGLGIRTLRFPVLWERHQPQTNATINWGWAAGQLQQIRNCGLDPVIGLVHHGSGPAFTSLIESSFAESLAKYAAAFSKKFPWVEKFTPVNEPLTTARFSGLYGHWYPHHRSDKSFTRILINQLKAVVLSMKAIREINSNAKLVQTEDLSKTYACGTLQYQACFENERRWLTYDLLSGKVDEDHALWDYLLSSGIQEKELEFFLASPCPPDIAGFNYYVTSERYLDDNIDKYPSHLHGGNRIEKYVDTEAIRISHEEPKGLPVLLTEAWERFGLPMALTEVHMNCSREEQLRWFTEVWDTCCRLNVEGIDIRAVTAWSLQGAFGWNRLLTIPGGDYEPGVFDLRSSVPRETAMAKLLRGIGDKKNTAHPVLSDKGWWHRPNRFYETVIPGNCNETSLKGRPILIAGKTGTLGKSLARIARERGLPYRLLDRAGLDICNAAKIEETINFYKPWAIINAAGYTDIDGAESDREKCFLANCRGPELLSLSCREHGIKLVSFSSHLVFDGYKKQPYIESDPVHPLNIFGQSKASKEKSVLQLNSDALIIRTSAFFSPWSAGDFVHNIISALRSGETFCCPSDIIMSPTFIPDLVHAVFDLLIDDEKGLWHLANDGETSWFDFARQIAARAGLNSKLLRGKPAAEMGFKAIRPLYNSIKSQRASILPSLDHAIERYFLERKVIREAAISYHR